MNDPYGLLASGLPPDMAAEAMGLSRQQQVMQALMQQAQQPVQVPEAKGRFTARISPLAPLSQALLAMAAQKGMGDTDQKMAGLASRRQQAVADAMTNYQQTRNGAPAQNVPNLVPNDDEGNPLPSASTPAVPGDRRAAVMQAMLNPLLANNPLVQKDLSKIEPDYVATKQFNPATGREERVLVDKNNPATVVPLGGQKAPEMKPVTTVDPTTHQPVTSFVNPNEQTTPLPQPVKMEMKDTGKVIVPVNPYNPDPLAKTTTPGEDQSARTAVRGQDLHRETSLQVAGLDQDGNPTGDIAQIAGAIAKGQMPPLSAFALARPRGQQIMSEVYKINPDYDVKDFHAADKAVNQFASGKLGNQVRSFNVGLSHLDTLGGLADALQNGDTQLVNKMGNAYAAQTGGPAPTNFDAAKKIVGDEIVKAIVGSGGGVGDREKAAEVLSRANSPAQLRGVINTYQTLMKGQLGGLRQQYEQSTGRKDFDRFLSQEAQVAAHGNAPAASGTVLRFDAQGNPL